uniref:Helicase, SNF2/RAD54 family n=1 Tax=Rheinheimera sp. BAL341 TaxID=1708203 RepID=A0A486XPP9_9GAMM
MSTSIAELSHDYRQFDRNDLSYTFSDRVLNPTLYIEKKNGKYVASLGAFVSKSGHRKFINCPTIHHNWLVDAERIKPLPYDAPQVICSALQGTSAEDLRFPEVLHFIRNGIPGIEISIAPSVIENANTSSSLKFLPSDVEGLNAKLYPYQDHGVAWLNEALDTIGGAILADEMGLGKTLQIIALLLIKKPTPESPALIVCPTSLIANWSREISKFAPTLTHIVHRGCDRSGYYKNLMISDIVITTYDTLVNDITLFRSIDWHFVICDEAQALKNPNSKRRIALSTITRRYLIPVTGTPVENSLMDLCSLADLAIPSVLGSQETFSENYPDTECGARDLSSITDIFVLKRQVKDVADDLPPRTDVDIPIELDPHSIAEYERIRAETINEYGSAGQLVAVGQLALYCAHPWLRAKKFHSEDWDEQVEIQPDLRFELMTPKMELCIQLLKEAARNHKKVLIFAAYNCCGDLIKRAASENRLSVNYWDAINGSTPQQERQSIIDRFTSVEGPAVLVLNPKAAGAGLNITAATMVIHYTQNWNPALEMQASARSHRRGQTHPVTIYRLYFEGTVEATMIERCLWKRELGEGAIPISTRDKQDLGKALMESPIKEIK